MPSYDDPGSSSNVEPGPPGGSAPSDFQTVVGHALVDPEFRDRLINSSTRGEAVKSVTGREMSEDLSTAIDDALASLNNLANQFGDYKAAT
jgi:hypothetical protein